MAAIVVHSAGSARMSRRIIVIVHRHDLRGLIWVRVHAMMANMTHVIVISQIAVVLVLLAAHMRLLRLLFEKHLLMLHVLLLLLLVSWMPELLRKVLLMLLNTLVGKSTLRLILSSGKVSASCTLELGHHWSLIVPHLDGLLSKLMTAGEASTLFRRVRTVTMDFDLSQNFKSVNQN